MVAIAKYAATQIGTRINATQKEIGTKKKVSGTIGDTCLSLTASEACRDSR